MLAQTRAAEAPGGDLLGSGRLQAEARRIGVLPAAARAGVAALFMLMRSGIRRAHFWRPQRGAPDFFSEMCWLLASKPGMRDRKDTEETYVYY